MTETIRKAYRPDLNRSLQLAIVLLAGVLLALVALVVLIAVAPWLVAGALIGAAGVAVNWPAPALRCELASSQLVSVAYQPQPQWYRERSSAAPSMRRLALAGVAGVPVC